MTSPKELAAKFRAALMNRTYYGDRDILRLLDGEEAHEIAAHLDRLSRIDDATQDVAEIRERARLDHWENAHIDRATLLSVVDRMAGENVDLRDRLEMALAAVDIARDLPKFIEAERDQARAEVERLSGENEKLRASLSQAVNEVQIHAQEYHHVTPPAIVTEWRKLANH